ncbi:MAG TPA: response regulator [Candidatus Saccharimonadales bacterium]|nr:response regulator [Candidatus Saccharimonadales bacterium]
MSKVQPINILLVDDDEDDLFFAQRALQKSKLPSNTYMVHDGIELLQYLNHEGPYTPETAPLPDLILLDLNMPKMNGKEALKAIRAHKKLAHLPVILFTTSSAVQDIMASYQLGANSYIKKPGDFQALVDIMDSLKAYWMQHATLPPKDWSPS